MDKIQTIEKLFKYVLEFTLEYSYLLLPLAFLITIKRSIKNRLFILLAFYGLIFFLFLHFFYAFPVSYRRLEITMYTFLEYTFFALILYHYIKNTNARKVIISLSFCFLVFQIFFYLKNSRYLKLDSVPIAIETFLIFVFIIFYFRQFFKNNVSNNVYEYPSFWIIVGILVYLGSGFFFNLLVNHVTEDQFKRFWHYTYIPDIIKNLLFTMVISGYPTLKNEKVISKPISPDIPNLDMI